MNRISAPIQQHFRCVVLPLLAAAQLAGTLNGQGASPSSDEQRVGRTASGQIVTPVNQVLTPAGLQVDLPGMRPLAAVLSPNGELLAVSGKTSQVVILDPANGNVRQRVELPAEDDLTAAAGDVPEQILSPDQDPQISYTGLLFSPQGDRLYLSNVQGSIKTFAVSPDGNVSSSHSLPLPAANAPRREAEIPSGLGLSLDGTRLYVCGNLSNRLLELDSSSGELLREFAVGVAPYDVVLAGSKAYVSNWGGRRVAEGDVRGPAGRGTVVRVDPVRRVASEGSVSIIDLEQGKPVTEVVTGLHACGLAASPDGRYVVCANAGSDTLSVISTATDSVVATLWAKPQPSDLLGASPNAVAFHPTGEGLYAANGAQNAIACFQFVAADPKESSLRGLIPVGWYPGALALDAARLNLIAANIKGLAKSPERPPSAESPDAVGFNSHQYFGSLSIVPIPAEADLAAASAVVDANLRRPRIAEALLPARNDQPPRAIPQRIGEPSLIKHVVYIIKENRTYDQVLGDMPQGNGDPSLCVFGERTTPNHHQIARDFVLLDNAYCAGILSADGHQWSTSAYSTDYMEKSFAGFARSYPDGFGGVDDDALAYSPAGFIWDNALRHNKTIRNYGEFMAPGSRSVRWRDAGRSDSPTPAECYQAWRDGRASELVFDFYPSIETIRPFSPADFPGWNMAAPDQLRADYVLKELQDFEKKGEFPELVILCLFNDHGAGTSAGFPTPQACVADNDLALGRVLEGLSRSQFWKEMAVFVIEDDPQAGWDHVSGYRTVVFCASPYAKRGAVVSTQYNTTSILRTIEQILGLPPMNQFDASATPMFDCFADQADFAPYKAAPAAVPLDEYNPDPNEIGDAVLRDDAVVSSQLNFRQLDKAPEDVLNRILWRSMKGTQTPYPEWAVTAIEADADDDGVD
ncbi:MAG: bifunctional YncE family protein/alkaline phosphatase family protein [Pirellulales bacterium]|nr:bifunctional YncE family protein/alkaline phosphatase family protein [Pirellulales bacterium]